MSIIENSLIRLLQLTAWRMDAPQVGSAFHIISVALISAAAIFTAWKVSRIDADQVRIRILGICGWLMAAGEIYKQLFYYYIVNDGAYDWWFFPFQLCSVPMYLCILLPIFYKYRKPDTGDKTAGSSVLHLIDLLYNCILTFLCGFTFVSAVSALIWPEDMLRPFAALTWHGLIWHGILLFISVLIGMSGMADLSPKGYLRSVVLFLGLCLTAFAINAALEPLSAAHPVYTAGGAASYPNMFYISPYHPSYQPFVSEIGRQFGRPAAIIVYIAAITALAGITDHIMHSIETRRTRR